MKATQETTSKTAMEPDERADEGDAALERRVWAALREVYDPEIPTISVVDLGIVHRVAATPERVRVEIMPTFVACPALDVMRRVIGERLVELDLAPEVSVGVTFAEQWTSDRITPAGMAALRAAGFAPPAGAPSFTADSVVNLDPRGALRPALVACPYCGSKSTTLENRFGPTLCRSIYYCNNCRQPFEAFKAV
ncbi:MAG TPA: 1,2-phenylacetyl-CoA epoxidase subunit PaaD [Thermomicrobiales bacterium]|nr:1,2-phenylacetyl-CoA epoxidase subunit PaaD [Thermomicrobiales bacterium]